ncbi:hypothetical protein CDAR_423041 [Caerostris darwini]|uniref:Uncharacterized protein n=1 Tax=Caerostris darwini TaxID=1538125 RepID=A0AAV4TF02_9ARAC|nr:hypothetical protein CDAR_423041 [Caerostris darwini]
MYLNGDSLVLKKSSRNTLDSNAHRKLSPIDQRLQSIACQQGWPTNTGVWSKRFSRGESILPPTAAPSKCLANRVVPTTATARVENRPIGARNVRYACQVCVIPLHPLPPIRGQAQEMLMNCSRLPSLQEKGVFLVRIPLDFLNLARFPPPPPPLVVFAWEGAGPFSLSVTLCSFLCITYRHEMCHDSVNSELQDID